MSKLCKSEILLQQLEDIHLIVNFNVTIYLQFPTENTEYITLQPSQIKCGKNTSVETKLNKNR